MSNTDVNYKLSLTDLLTPKIKNATAETNKLESALNGIGSKISLALGGIGLGMFAKNIFDAGVQVEQLNVAFKTMLGSKEKADSLMMDISNFAKTTPFELSEVATASKQLLAFGIEQENIISTMRSLGDVASGISAPIGDIAYLFGTIKTQGRAMTMDINQFANRGIPIWEELRKATGLSGQALKKFVEDGKVDFNLINNVFERLSGNGGKFFNLMDAQSKTTGGRLSNLKDQFFALSVTIFNELKPAIDSVIKGLASLIETFRNGIQWIKEHRVAIAGVAGALGGLLSVIIAYEVYQKTVWIVNGAIAIYNLWKMAAALGGVTLAQYALNTATAIFDALSGNWVALAAGAAILAGGIWAAYKAQQSLNGATAEYKGVGAEKALTGGLQTTNPNIAKSDVVKTKSSKQSGGTDITKVEAKGAQNFNITINKLVETIQVNTTNMKETTSRIKDEVAKALIVSVNDFQTMATK